MNRRGFTLLEMLVASMVFVVGFVAVFTLFIAGLKFRAQGDLETRSAIALRNLVEEIQLDAGTESKAPLPPSAYIGSGFADPQDKKLATSGGDDELIPCPGMPGLFYRVMSASDCTGGKQADSNVNASVIYLRVLVVAFPTTGNEPLALKTLARRLAIRVGGDDFIPELVRRGVATDNHVAIIRQPSWMKNTPTK